MTTPKPEGLGIRVHAREVCLIPISQNRDRCHRTVDFSQVAWREFDCNGADVRVKAVELPAARDRNNPRLLGQQPGERNLCLRYEMQTNWSCIQVRRFTSPTCLTIAGLRFSLQGCVPPALQEL